MRVIVADETGLLKSIELEKDEQVIISNRQQPSVRARAVQRMCWYQDETQNVNARENVVLARASNVVEAYSSAHAKPTVNREANWSFTAPAGKCVGLGMIQQFGSVVRCADNGDVFVKSTLTESAKPATFNAAHQTAIAVGGKERDLNIWSLERQEAIFKAKNVTHDKLDMRVPVWVKDLQFMSQGNSNGHRVVIYDTNTKRRPIQQIEFGEYPINAVCVSPDERQVFIADTTGNLDVMDLRTLNGAIRDIACHPTLPYVAAVGLDRMVHVFDINTRKYQHMIYAKQRLNSVLFCNDGVKAVPVVVSEPASKKRRHNDDEPAADGEDDDDDELEEVEYEGLEISDEEEEDDDDDDDDEEELEDGNEDEDDDEDADSDAS
ncbi:TPA: hypothetical protein N0F65_002106 [Lagenidium giganteum]|uniref:Uncharacterized protein n=1 Tax=Lagenidium giganteum TaxID=4803 RepID=A0AAV2ZEH6_9STRA|nr:TPA: hypothetical protein N0F65_002106 [Lagenidium giganteum]